MPSTEAQKRASARYRNKAYKTITVDVPPDTAILWRSMAASAGLSLRAYIMQAVQERMTRDAAGSGSTDSDTAGTFGTV